MCLSQAACPSQGPLEFVMFSQAADEDLTQLGPKTEPEARKRQRIEAMAGKLPAVLAALRAEQAQQAQQTQHGEAATDAAAAVESAARSEAAKPEAKPAMGLKEVVEAAVDQMMPEAAEHDVAHEGALCLLGPLWSAAAACAVGAVLCVLSRGGASVDGARFYCHSLLCCIPADDAFSDTEGEQAPGGGDAELAAAADAAQLPSDLASLKAMLAELPWWVGVL